MVASMRFRTCETTGVYGALEDRIEEHGYRTSEPDREERLNDPSRVEACEFPPRFPPPSPRPEKGTGAAPEARHLAALRL